MSKARISVETMTIPTYPELEHEEMPMFVENRVHQRSSGRIYPNRILNRINRASRVERDYIAVHLENEYLDVWVLPEIGGRIFAARDKATGYDFFYRQHVIKPALIGVLGSWISGGVEFNWPYHHRPSGFKPCDFVNEELEDGSVVCWLSEHEPVSRMKGMVGIVLRPGCSYLETRVKLCNRTPVRHSFLWWENTAVPVNENYRIFFPHDVTYVNFHYLTSRATYPVAGNCTYNGIEMAEPRDLSWHKNTHNATSYFACASKYDFFGGYDYGRDCGVVHIADHHISPGKKMFTWGYKQLSKSWENALTDEDGQYAELMAGSYSDNQPDFTWLEPYETKEFSQFWYPIEKIGAPDFANLRVAARLGEGALRLQATEALGRCLITVGTQDGEFLRTHVELHPGRPVEIPWNRPVGLLRLRIEDESGAEIARYDEEIPDELKMSPVREAMPLAAEVESADELYRAGVHVDQYRDPAVEPDAYWLEALKRNPNHAPSLIAMAEYCYRMLRFEEAKRYAERGIRVLTQFNERLESGNAYYIYALILDALGEEQRAYDHYYKAAWSADGASKAMARVACLDLRRGDGAEALRHADWALKRDALNPLAPVAKMLACPERAREIGAHTLGHDPLHLLARYLLGEEGFFASLHSEAAQSALDMAFDLAYMGQCERARTLLEELAQARPEQKTAMLLFATAYYRKRLGMGFAHALAEAETAPLGDAYPFRMEEAEILRFAAGEGSSRAAFLLGCLLYDRRHYEQAAKLFSERIAAAPDDYMAYRCLAVACYSHLGREAEALKWMREAMERSDSVQVLYETVVLMNKLGAAPAEKIALIRERAGERDDLTTELAKAYNQNEQPEKALEVLNARTFVPCEGGEHAIADQYMFAWYQLGVRRMLSGEYEAAMEEFERALTLPKNLGAGIWNRCKYVPYQFRIGECLLKLGKRAEAEVIFREILGIEVEFFSNMYLPELPYYQAMSARYLGMPQVGQRIMTDCKRLWTREIERKDNGFFSTTPFFISFVDDPARMRRAHYLYLCALVDAYDGWYAGARAKLQESYLLNGDNLFCGLFARTAALEQEI